MTGGEARDLRQDSAFFGRTEELYRLVRNLQRGRHTLITGDKGIGKTRLMAEAREILSGKTRRIDFSAFVLNQKRSQLGMHFDAGRYKMLCVERSSPLSACLQEIAEKLCINKDFRGDTGPARVKKGGQGKGNARLESLILEGIARSENRYLVWFDELDRITACHKNLIETLMNISVVCAAAVSIKDCYILKRVWASFSRLNLERLPERECAELIDYFLGNYNIRTIDAELYRGEILKASDGNPFHMKNMLWHGQREKYLDAREIRKLREIDEGRYFNMGPVYIFGIGVFTLVKIFSSGADDKEFYIYFSALGFISYLVFRVFRAFFLFRPQKFR